MIRTQDCLATKAEFLSTLSFQSMANRHEGERFPNWGKQHQHRQRSIKMLEQYD